MVTPVPDKITDQSFCKAACEHIGPNGLNCEEGLPIEMKISCKLDSDCEEGLTCSRSGSCQASCEKFCIDTENAGVFLLPACVVNVKTCADIDSCSGTRPVKN